MKVIFVNIFKITLFVYIPFFLTVNFAFANPVIPYSGYLTSKDKAVSGELKMKFELCPTKTSASNTCWSSAKSTSPQEQWTEISVFNGYFQVNLGDSTRMNTLKPSDLASLKLYLKIHVKNSKVEVSLPARLLQTVAPALDASQVLSFKEEESLTRAHRRPRVKSPYPRSELKKLKKNIKKIGPYEYDIDRAIFDQQLKDLGGLARQARVIPHYQSGKPAGFKLVGVRPNSFFRLLGIRSGDVIKSLAGKELTSINKSLVIFQRLKTLQIITVNIIRRGKPISFKYNINSKTSTSTPKQSSSNPETQ